MITFASVVRTSDGLALSESTDVEETVKFRSVKKSIKLLAKKARSLTEKSFIKLDGQKILMTTSMGISFMMLCDLSYPNVLAYSFLNDIQKEFVCTYSTKHISLAIRPYAFIEFDFNIKQIKQHYNNPKSLATKLDLKCLSEELKNHPPFEIPSTFLKSQLDYGIDRKYVDPMKQCRSEPISSFAWMSIAVTTICAFFNFSRGVIFLNASNWDGFDHKSPVNGVIFLFEALIEILQICLLINHVRMKLVISFLMFGLFSICCIYQQEVKNNMQILTQVACSAFITIHIYLRKVYEKPPHYNV